MSADKLREIARAASAAPQRHAPPPARFPRWPYFAMGAVALLAVIGTLYDAKLRLPVPPAPATEVAIALTNMFAQRVADPGGQFSVPLPPGWTIDPAAKRPYSLALRSGNGPSISLMSTNVNHSSLARLTDEIRRHEAEGGIATVMDPQTLGNRVALARRATLVYERVLAIDFVEEGVACHMLCAAPKELYPVYEPVFLRVAEEIRIHAATNAAAEPLGERAAGIPGSL